MSVRPSAWNNSALIGWIFMKFDIWILKKIVVVKEMKNFISI